MVLTTSRTILVVDDEQPITRLVTRILENAGYQCFSGHSLAEGREILGQHAIDLLLCDLMLAEESGVDLIRYTKHHFPRTGRVIITGHGSPELAASIMDLGIYGYILKPIQKNELLITVENSLHHLRLDLEMEKYKKELESNISLRSEKLAAIMNNLEVGVVMYDLELKILEMNRRMERWFPGYRVEDATPCHELFGCDADRTTGKNCPMYETQRTGRTGEAKRQIKCEDGVREFRIVTTPIFDSDGRISAGIALYEDVTDKLKLERDLRQAQKLEAVGQLAAGIAHEINSPVQYIGDNISFLGDCFKDFTGVLQVYEEIFGELQDQGLLSDTFVNDIRRIYEDSDLDYLREEIPKTVAQSLDGVRRVDQIVKAMKDFSHPGGDEKVVADINNILESTITVCRNEWKYVAEVETEFARDLEAIPCFPGDLGQVFLNIIVNGAHAIAEVTEGGRLGLGTIGIVTERCEKGIRVRISDSGCGIPEAIRERVFDPFFTTKARGRGTGQGLAIAHRVVVDKHQGAISLSSREGEGTTFVIELPVTPHSSLNLQ